MRRPSRNLVKGLLLLFVYLAAGFVFEPFYHQSPILALLLILLFFPFLISGLVAEVSGHKPSTQFWFAFGTLGAVLGAATAAFVTARLLISIPVSVHIQAAAFVFAVVLGTIHLCVLVFLFWFFVPYNILSQRSGAGSRSDLHG